MGSRYITTHIHYQVYGGNQLDIFSDSHILETIFVPLLISGVLFYLTVPLQTLLEKFKFPRWSSIVIIFLLLLALLWAAIAIVGPPITKQVNNLIEKTPTFIDEGIDI